MREPSFHPDAIQEAREARLWYQARSDVAAAAFMAELDHAIASITEAPDRWPVLANGRRRFVLQRFPFVIWYRIREHDLRISAIAHARRRPGYWKSRDLTET